jgi:HSP20 family protein
MAATPVAAQRAKEQPLTPQKSASESAIGRMDAVFDEIARRAFQIFEGNGRVFGCDLEDWFKAERELFRPVHTELTEADESLQIKAEVPGFSEKEVEITVQPRRVVIIGKHESADKEQKKSKVVCSETYSEQLFRIVDLPVEIETDKVTASLKNGVLVVAMPKAAKARTVCIAPTAA